MKHLSHLSLPPTRKQQGQEQCCFPLYTTYTLHGFPGDSGDKESACSVGDPGFILQLGRSPGEGNSNPPQYSFLRKGRGTRDQIANIHWILEKRREFQKNIYFCFIDCAKAFDSVDHNELWKILKEMGIPDYLTCLLRNLYAGQEATVRTGHEQQTGSK